MQKLRKGDWAHLTTPGLIPRTVTILKPAKTDGWWRVWCHDLRSEFEARDGELEPIIHGRPYLLVERGGKFFPYWDNDSPMYVEGLCPMDHMSVLRQMGAEGVRGHRGHDSEVAMWLVVPQGTTVVYELVVG
jgi:hypothetical protein